MFELNKYTSNKSKGCVLEVDLEYPKELWELHNYYHLAPPKKKTKEKCCLSVNQGLLTYTVILLAMLKN